MQFYMLVERPGVYHSYDQHHLSTELISGVEYAVCHITYKNGVRSRDAKFPGILKAVSFHREYWEFCGNIGNFWEYSETLGILK